MCEPSQVFKHMRLFCFYTLKEGWASEFITKQHYVEERESPLLLNWRPKTSACGICWQIKQHPLDSVPQGCWLGPNRTSHQTSFPGRLLSLQSAERSHWVCQTSLWRRIHLTRTPSQPHSTQARSTLEKPAPAGASGPGTPPCQPGLGRVWRQVGVVSRLCYILRPGTQTGHTSATQGQKQGNRQ